MSRRRSVARYLRASMIAMALLLPALSLIPFGSLWLWQQGYLLYWVGAALALSVASYLLQLWLVRSANPAPVAAAASQSSIVPDPAWTPRELTAWNAVQALATSSDPAQITSRDALVDLALRTVDTVARSIHPQDNEPLWRFTVPEALALIERVSRDLKPFVVDNIPLGDQLTVAQVIKIYRWRSAIDVAEKAYDIWRIVRLLNPITAVTNEARERLSKKLYAGVRDELARRLTQGFVKEVGRAAIDLYGGRLRVSGEELADHVSDATERDRKSPEIAEPLRVLVAGQISAGKSSLINALTRELRAAVDVLPVSVGFTAYELKHETLPPILLIDSPGVQPHAQAQGRLAEEAGTCDLIIWVTPANRADRNLDRQALDVIRAFFVNRPDRRHPPILALATHIDQLRPFQEWTPPYDINDSSNEKAKSIRAALEQVARDLGLAMDNVVPVSMAAHKPPYNIAQVWTKVAELLPEATRAQLVRRMRGASGWKWRKLWSQAVNAGRLTTRALSK